MERILKLLVGDKVLVYLDNVLILMAIVDVVLETLRQVLELLAKANHKCKLSKCSLFAESILITWGMW